MMQDCEGCIYRYLVCRRSWNDPEEWGCSAMDDGSFWDEDYDELECGACPHYQQA